MLRQRARFARTLRRRHAARAGILHLPWLVIKYLLAPPQLVAGESHRVSSAVLLNTTVSISELKRAIAAVINVCSPFKRFSSLTPVSAMESRGIVVGGAIATVNYQNRSCLANS
jgi:hypothetical protein